MPLENKSDTAVLEKLLNYDLQRFAASLGYSTEPEPLTNEFAATILNLAERCSHKFDDHARQSCLMICGLITEHWRPEWAAAPAYIVNLLSRIGLGPSMRMADPEYRERDDSFASLGSFAAEIAVTLRCMRCEVIAADRIRLLLSDFQFGVWNLVEKHRRVGISAPTSAGKSYVLVSKILDILFTAPGVAVFIVPTISLIYQVTRDIRETATKFGMNDVGVYQSYLADVVPRHRSVVFVLTQERALSALSQGDALKGCRIVVIDEVQNVERVSTESDERAHLLLETIHEFEATRDAEKIIISGPRIENIGQLARGFFGPDAVPISAGLPPVVNITYTFAEAGARGEKKVLLKQYVEVSDKPRSLELVAANNIRGVFKQQTYSNSIHEILADLTTKLSTGHGTLIFSPKSEQATKTAIAIADRVQLKSDSHIPSLIQYVSDTVHEKYALVNSLSKGIAFHHGKMPQHIRIAVEQAFSKQYISAIVCTTTLMQGVNLPAKNIIARNPNLFLKRGLHSHKLTPYEFANLRGRAGRLLKDFVGRSLILDENWFDNVDEYVGSPGTNVISGYEHRFEESRDEILEQLLANDRSGGDAARDMVTYIRHTIFRYKASALERLNRVGISITDDEFFKISSLVSKLEVPLSVVERNASWDPLDLQVIHTAQVAGEFQRIPNRPFADGFVDNIVSVVQTLTRLTPFYVTRYLGEVNEKYLQSIAISAQSWCAEKPLKEIISWSPARNLTWETIDRRLKTLLKSVVFDLPKLLRPVAMMQDVENSLLGFVELGAYRPDSRRLIELGLPRETAIRCTAKFASIIENAVNDTDLVLAAKAASNELTEWDRLQIEELI